MINKTVFIWKCIVVVLLCLLVIVLDFKVFDNFTKGISILTTAMLLLALLGDYFLNHDELI